MVIVSLLTAGVGLALDAYAERQSARDQRRNATLLHQDVSNGVSRLSNEDLGNFLILPIDTEAASDFAGEKDHRDALKELQNYADFQKSLSDNILDGLAQEETPMSESCLSNSLYNNDFHTDFYSGYIPWSPPRKCALTQPVVIPANTGIHEEYGWPRAYISSLMDCGIDQQTFLAFIISLNESLIVSDIKKESGFELMDLPVITSSQCRQYCRAVICHP